MSGKRGEARGGRSQSDSFGGANSGASVRNSGNALASGYRERRENWQLANRMALQKPVPRSQGRKRAKGRAGGHGDEMEGQRGGKKEKQAEWRVEDVILRNLLTN